jgi:hypothetical protein
MELIRLVADAPDEKLYGADAAAFIPGPERNRSAYTPVKFDGDDKRVKTDVSIDIRKYNARCAGEHVSSLFCWDSMFAFLFELCDSCLLSKCLGTMRSTYRKFLI